MKPRPRQPGSVDRRILIAAMIAGSAAAGGAAFSCDTWIAMSDVTACGSTILAKNSDRPVFDCQPLVFNPRRAWSEDAVINVGRVKIPQAAETYATIGSSPYWCWGYEEGMNEFGVAAGNEGIATRMLAQHLAAMASGAGPDLGLTGMDLLRLGLERGRTAMAEIQVIRSLLEKHGQFGSGLPTMEASSGAYHNSYIIADPVEAWVLETAGRQWVARRIQSGSTSISNTPSIGEHWDLSSTDLAAYAVGEGWWPQEKSGAFDFTLAYGDDSPTARGQRAMSLPRAACSSGLLRERHGTVDPRWMMRIARDESSSPPINLDKTASSCVAVLPKSADELPVFWWCPAVPGDSCYVPFFVHGSALPPIVSTAGTQGRTVRPPSGVEPDSFAPDSYWWIFRDLHELASGGVEDGTPVVREAFDALERAFEQGLPAVLTRAATLRRSGRTEEAAQALDAYSKTCLDRAVAKAHELREALREDVAGAVPARFQPYVGRYDAAHKREAHTVKVLGGRLAIDVPGQRVYELLAPDESGRRQFALTDQISVSFVHDEDGAVIGMIYHQGGMDLEAWREGYDPPVDVIAQDVADLLGQYRFAQANLEATVLVERGRLAVDVTGQMIFVLRRSDAEDEWIARATTQIVVTFQTDEDGAVTTMTIRQAGRPVVFQRVTDEGGDD